MFRQLLGYLGEYKKPAIASIVIIIAEVASEIVIPFLTSKLIQEVMNGADQSVLWYYGRILIACALVSLTFGALAVFTSSKAASGFAKNLRHKLFVHIQSFSFSNVDRFSSASLITRLTTDVEFVRQAFLVAIRQAARAPFLLTFALIMGFITGGRIAWIYCFTVPVLGFSLFLIIRSGLPLFRKLFKKYDKFNLLIQENVKGMRVVKSFVREDYEVERFTGASGELRKVFTKIERKVALLDPIMQFCLNVVMFFILSYGSYVVMTTHGVDFNVGQISAMLTYSFMMLMSLIVLSMVLALMIMAQESGRRIIEVLDEKSSLTNKEDAVHDIPDGSVVMENVSFKYAEDAERNALENINLNIRSGEFVGVIGATGSGKTTLVQLIPRLYDVSSGSVRVGGIDVRDYDLKALRKAVAMVLQKNVLFSGTISENLRWGNKDATDEMLIEACKMAQAHDFISAFPDGYNTMIEQGGTNVSGGQKQRICIARALLAKPKVLILDDSTSAVDMKTDARIQEALRSYIPETTKIVIAQRIASVQDADHIVILNDGGIEAVGTHDELLRTNEIYREVYDSQTRKEVFHA